MVKVVDKKNKETKVDSPKIFQFYFDKNILSRQKISRVKFFWKSIPIKAKLWMFLFSTRRLRR